MVGRFSLALLAVTGCTTPEMLAFASAGPAKPLGASLADETGVAGQLVFGADGAGTHLSYRHAGDTQEVALGFDVTHVEDVSRTLTVYVRAALNLIEWDRVGTDDGAGTLGPTFEVGLCTRTDGFLGRAGPGLTLSLSAARDVRFNDRDDNFVSVQIGFGAIVAKHHY